MPEPVTRLVGVYDADGGVRGELAYVLGRLLRRTHCSLCDATHAGMRRKPAWDAMVARLGVPFALVHLNEMAPDVAAVLARTGPPAVLAQVAGSDLRPVLVRADLDALGGSVEELEATLRAGAGGRRLDAAVRSTLDPALEPDPVQPLRVREQPVGPDRPEPREVHQHQHEERAGHDDAGGAPRARDR